jgi:hypothetical protein
MKRCGFLPVLFLLALNTRTYRFGDGKMTFTVGQPPPGFRPEQATDEELERYGFPPRPATAAQLQQWTELMTNYKGAAPPAACEGLVAPYSTTNEPVEYGKYYTKTWSGYLARSAEGGGRRLVAAFGHFYEPSGNAYPSCKSNALVANWLGLGGYFTGRLIQAGTGTATNNVHTAWFTMARRRSPLRSGLEPAKAPTTRC